MIKSLLYRLRLIRKSGKLKILVVDDEPRFAKIIKRVLSSDEYDVQGADTAIAALKRIKREKFDLIIMGIRMPGMSGIEFYHRIEETNRSYLNKIIFATGDYKSEECVDFFSRTGVPWFPKPFTRDDLLRAVKTQLKKNATLGHASPL